MAARIIDIYELKPFDFESSLLFEHHRIPTVWISTYCKDRVSSVCTILDTHLMEERERV